MNAAGDDWDDIGEISDLVLSQDGQVKAVLTDIGGFLGLGERDMAGPTHQIPAAFHKSRDVTLHILKEAGHSHTPRVSVSRSIFPLLDDRDREYFGRGGKEQDQIGLLGGNTRAIFGRGYTAEPEALIAQLREDEAIAEADTLLLTIPNQLGVEYCAHVIEGILKHIAPALGWR